MVIPDARLINDTRPQLWATFGVRQLALTAPDDLSPTDGPALTATNLIPDLHHYAGRGGRVFPLWADAAATQPNFAPGLLVLLGETYGSTPAPEDVFAYLAAVAAHPGYVGRFHADLATPGLRIPLTADPVLFAEAAALGREIVWLHSYGERFANPAAGRPHGAPRLPEGERPLIPAAGSIPATVAGFPDTMTFDAASRRLHIGTGFVDNVLPEVWGYTVSGKRVLTQWFSYRKKNRDRPIIGDRRPPSPLGDIQPDHWLAEYTSDLIDLLNVLGRLVLLEPAQADVLARICIGSLIDSAAVAASRPPPQPQQKTKSRRRGKVANAAQEIIPL